MIYYSFCIYFVHLFFYVISCHVSLIFTCKRFTWMIYFFLHVILLQLISLWIAYFSVWCLYIIFFICTWLIYICYFLFLSIYYVIHPHHLFSIQDFIFSNWFDYLMLFVLTLFNAQIICLFVTSTWFPYNTQLIHFYDFLCIVCLISHEF